MRIPRIQPDLLAFAVLTICGLALYWQTLPYPFVFDDRQNIKDNRAVQIDDLSWESLRNAAVHNQQGKRPVSSVSFALNYYFSGLNPSAFRLTNIGIHIFSGILIYALVILTLNLEQGWGENRSKKAETNRGRRDGHIWSHSRNVAMATAIIWLVHPLQTQSVIYIVQRMNSLAVLFYLSSLNLYILGRLSSRAGPRFLWFGAALATGGLALGCKEIAFTLPVIILMYEWYFFQTANPRWWLRSIKFAVPALIALGVLAWLRLNKDPMATITAVYQNRDFTMAERVLTQFRVIVHYVTLLLFPHPDRLNLDYDFPVSTSLFSPVSTMLCLALLLGALGIGIVSAREQPVLSFCILWFFVNLAIESSVIGLEMVFEHRMYMPSIGIILALVYSFHRFVPLKIQFQRPLVLLVVALALAGATLVRSRVWSDALVLWKDCARKSPAKSRVRNNLGMILGERGSLEEAVVELRESCRLDPSYAQAFNNLGVVYAKQGRHEAAIEEYRKALGLRSAFGSAHHNIGQAFLETGRAEDAIRHLKEAVRYIPGVVDAYIDLGSALIKMNGFAEAEECLATAARLNPGYWKVHNNRGIAAARQKRFDEAVRHFRKAAELSPGIVDVHFNLANAHRDVGDVDNAIRNYRAALEVSPGYGPAHRNLARVFVGTGRYEDAVENFNAAEPRNPDPLRGYDRVAHSLLQKQQYSEAVAMWTKALTIDPRYGPARNGIGRTLLHQGKTVAALAYYRTHGSGDSGATAYCEVAAVLLAENRYGEAIAAYDEALQVEPDHTRARHDYFQALSDAGLRRMTDGDNNGAVDCFRKAVGILPENAEGHNNLGAAVGQLGRIDAAITHFNEALRIDSNHEAARNNLNAARAIQKR